MLPDSVFNWMQENFPIWFSGMIISPILILAVAAAARSIL